MIIYKIVNKEIFKSVFQLEQKLYSLSTKLNYRMVRIDATPRVSLVDVIPKITVHGLDSGAPVTLTGELVDEKNKTFFSNAHYIADENGEVDVEYSTSFGGSYKGVFPTGLISTLNISDGSFMHGRSVKDKIMEPDKINISVFAGHRSLEAKGDVLCSVFLERHYVGPGVRRIQVRDGRIRGVLFLPKGEGPFPAIIDMNGAGGNPTETRAALNASRGIASLLLAYFNYDGLPLNRLFNLDLEYFEEATEYILSLPEIIPDRCGVIGNCVGGYIANMMGIHFDKVKAVISVNTPFNSAFADITYRGDLIEKGLILEPKHFRKFRDNSDERVASDELRHYFSNIETSVARKLLLAPKDTYFIYDIGAEDTYYYRDGLQKFIKILSEKNKQNISCTLHPNAGHIIDVPYSRIVKSAYVPLWTNQELDANSMHPAVIKFWGGSAEGDVQMQESIWKKSFNFFNKHIRDESVWYQNWLMKQSSASVT